MSASVHAAKNSLVQHWIVKHQPETPVAAEAIEKPHILRPCFPSADVPADIAEIAKLRMSPDDVVGPVNHDPLRSIGHFGARTVRYEQNGAGQRSAVSRMNPRSVRRLDRHDICGAGHTVDDGRGAVGIERNDTSLPMLPSECDELRRDEPVT